MGPVKIEELEGEITETTDHFFVKIGESLPLKPNDFNFDLETLPSQSLALSDRFRLTFVAHSSGFYVAKTKDLIDSAKEIKENGSGSSVQELSLVDVSIGRVRILALSTDNSTLAACVSGDIRFYSVDSFLKKEVKESFSCSLNDSTFVKDMRWITTSESSYVVLSNTGELYHGGTGGSSLKHMMDSVEAVDWGIKGTFVAVARKNVLSILSAKFEERVSISLPFGSWIGDSEANVSIIVDSVKCIRPDSIIIGCFQLTEDGKEENYLIQVIRSRHGEFTEGCCEVVVQSFSDIYQGLNDDIVPLGSGPCLLLTYLEQCQLAINANMKNTDEHIMLLGWSLDDDNSDAAVVDIQRDNCLPRIGLQENGDDNLVLGLCVDNVSIYQKVGVQLGVERTELSPFCVLVCLTLEGKVVMFHVANLSGSKVSPEVDSALHAEEDASVELPVDESSTFSMGSQKKEQKLDQALEVSEDLKFKPFSNPYQITRAEDYTKYPEVESATDVQSLKSDVRQMVPDVNVNQDTDSQNQCPPGEQWKNLGQKTPALGTSIGSFTVNRHSAAPSLSSYNNLQETTEMTTELRNTNSSRDLQRISPLLPGEQCTSLKSDVRQMVPDVNVNQDTDSQNQCPPGEQWKNLGQKTPALGTSIGSFTVNRHSAAPSLSSYNNLQETTEMTTELRNTNSSRDLQRISPLLPGKTFSFPKNSDVSSFSSSSGVGYQSQKYTMGATNVHAANVPGSMGGKSFLVRDVNGVSPAINSASSLAQSGGQLTSSGAGNIQPVLVSSSDLSSNGNATAEKSSVRKFHPSNEHGTSSKLAISSSDFLKQFGNINEMTKELDLLLKSIEEDGGFRDACTRSLRSSIEAVEQSMDTLSEQCKIWTCEVDQHLEEVHYLLNKTIQVVARKIYMEGIYKQASDSRFWDLWNRQKLNSELELKRRHILSLNQDLTCKLIELERHFNALELNKFSQYGGRHVGHGASQNRYGRSSYIQSLHSLHDAISSQLVAAENLSGCLSKQMAELSLRSPSEEQKNVKELFETIGIPYDASFGSPDMKGFMKTPSKKILFSDLTTNKDQSKRIQASAMKSCEPETARRRRDSLDQSWTCFEPPKTVIKRKLLQELQKPNRDDSFFSMNKEKVKNSMLEESAPHHIDARIPSVVFPASKMKASILDSHLELEKVSENSKAFIQADNLQIPTQVSDSKSRLLQRSNISAVPSQPAFQFSPAMVHGHSAETKDLDAEKSNDVQKFDLISNSENKSILHMKMPQKSSIFTYSTTETPLSLTESSEMPFTNSKMTMATSSTMKDKLSGAFTPVSWRKDFPSSESHSSTISAASTLLGKVTEFNVDKIPAVPTFSGSCESLSSLTTKTPSASPVSSSVSSATVPPAAVSVTLSSSMTSSSTQMDSNRIMSSSSLPKPSLLNSTSESLKSDIQPAAVSNLKTDLDAAAEGITRLNEPLDSESESKLRSSRKFSHEQSSNSITSSELNVVSVSQPEQPSDAPLQLSTSFLAPASVSSSKDGGLDIGISNEDEMEEEAPETSDTTELSLGSLGGFGIGSIPNPSVPKPNPFGSSFNNVATGLSSSTVTFSVPSGELFGPASFSFSSPQSSPPTQSTNSGAFSGGFSTGAAAVPTQAPSAFGQPAQGGSGQQVLGSVLGTFGQSRQLGSGLPGSGFAAPSGFGGGFGGSSSPSGFSNAAIGGGFAGIGSTGGGFAGMASTGGGFAGVASTGSGFSGIASVGGFGGAAASSTGGFAGAGSGGGFGAFSSQGSGGGFAAFGNNVGGKPPELFTQMRK